MDFNGACFLSVNGAMCNLSGYTRKELLAMNPMRATLTPYTYWKGGRLLCHDHPETAVSRDISLSFEVA